MKREILYRGKRTDTNQWIVGALCHNMNGGLSIMPKAFFGAVIDRLEEELDFDDDFDFLDEDEQGLAIGGWFDVIPETVGQYIEIKDNNDIYLYEGDIIEFMFFTYNGTEVEDLKKGVIVVDKLGVLFQTLEGGHYLCGLDFDSESQIKIIGNIIDTPELI
jgi:hypothetical protein